MFLSLEFYSDGGGRVFRLHDYSPKSEIVPVLQNASKAEARDLQGAASLEFGSSKFGHFGVNLVNPLCVVLPV